VTLFFELTAKTLACCIDDSSLWSCLCFARVAVDWYGFVVCDSNLLHGGRDVRPALGLGVHPSSLWLLSWIAGCWVGINITTSCGANVSLISFYIRAHLLIDFDLMPRLSTASLMCLPDDRLWMKVKVTRPTQIQIAQKFWFGHADSPDCFHIRSKMHGFAWLLLSRPACRCSLLFQSEWDWTKVKVLGILSRQ